MRLFLDCEFTGLHQKTTLISLALVAENGHEFYAEFNDYDRKQVDDWIREKVLSHTFSDGYATILNRESAPDRYVFGDRLYIVNRLREWLESLGDRLVIIGDVLAYDWVLFCELFGGALNLPKNVCYIPQDIATMLSVKGIDPDSSREFLVGEVEETVKHSALWDARIIKRCYERLIKE